MFAISKVNSNELLNKIDHEILTKNPFKNMETA